MTTVYGLMIAYLLVDCAGLWGLPAQLARALKSLLVILIVVLFIVGRASA